MRLPTGGDPVLAELLAVLAQCVAAGARRISADTALRLARYFGTSERFCIDLQARYDLEVERDRLGATLDQIQPLAGA